MFKRITALVCVLVLIASVFTFAGCSKKESEKVNIVLVLDVSTSMGNNDVYMEARDAISNYVSVFDYYKIPVVNENGAMDNTRFGVVTYGKDADVCIELKAAKDYKNNFAAEVREKINDIEYDDKSGTNFYAGLEKAYEMCEDNKADRNIIYVVSDGEFDLNGNKPDDVKKRENAKKDHLEFFEDNIQDNDKYEIHTIGINTKEKSNFDDLEELASEEQYFDTANEFGEIGDIFDELLEDIKKELNIQDQSSSLNGKIKKVEDGVYTVDLDKDYKTVKIRCTKVEPSAESMVELEKVKSPNDKKAKALNKNKEATFKGGFLGMTKSKVTANESSNSALNIYIDDAVKGKWTLYFDKPDVEINIEGTANNPFPWVPVIIVIVIGNLLMIYLVMWLFYIPPVRYRRKIIPGAVTVVKHVADDYGSGDVKLVDNQMFGTIKNKFWYKGHITLGALLNDKNYKKVVIKYHFADELENEKLTVKGTDKKGNNYDLTLFENSSGSINNEELNITITWDL